MMPCLPNNLAATLTQQHEPIHILLFTDILEDNFFFLIKQHLILQFEMPMYAGSVAAPAVKIHVLTMAPGNSKEAANVAA
jgi:hypothetical protein